MLRHLEDGQAHLKAKGILPACRWLDGGAGGARARWRCWLLWDARARARRPACSMRPPRTKQPTQATPPTHAACAHALPFTQARCGSRRRGTACSCPWCWAHPSWATSPSRPAWPTEMTSRQVHTYMITCVETAGKPCPSCPYMRAVAMGAVQAVPHALAASCPAAGGETSALACTCAVPQGCCVAKTARDHKGRPSHQPHVHMPCPALLHRHLTRASGALSSTRQRW